MPVSRAFALCFFLVGGFRAANSDAADRLLLRNLDFISDRTVTSFDEDGLVLDAPRPGAGNRITWDEVERGKVAIDQPRFDRLLTEFGDRLYRIRQRLKNGDYAAASEPAEYLFPKYSERKSQTAYLVCQATMWSRLASGRREAAVEPYLRCFELLRTRAASSANLPGSRRQITDAATAMCPELAPFWFNAAAAREELPKVQQTIRGLSQPRPEGAYVYYASLAIAAGEPAEAERVLPQLASGDMAWWRQLIEAERDLATGSASDVFHRLSASQASFPKACRPTASLLIGLAGAHCDSESDVRSGVLALLSLPANHSAEQPELAAAGLYHAAQALDKLKDGREAAAVRRELRSHFGHTLFGSLQPPGPPQ